MLCISDEICVLMLISTLYSHSDDYFYFYYFYLASLPTSVDTSHEYYLQFRVQFKDEAQLTPRGNGMDCVSVLSGVRVWFGSEGHSPPSSEL